MLLLKLKLGVLTVVDSGARQDRGHTEAAREEAVMNRPPLGSDAGAQGNVLGYITTRPHTVSMAQATQDMARLDGTTTTILEGPLEGRNVRLVWCQLGWVKLPKTGPDWTPSKARGLNTRQGGAKSLRFRILGSSYRTVPRTGLPTLRFTSPLASTVALLGHWRILCSLTATAADTSAAQLHPTCAALMGPCVVV